MSGRAGAVLGRRAQAPSLLILAAAGIVGSTAGARLLSSGTAALFGWLALGLAAGYALSGST